MKRKKYLAMLLTAGMVMQTPMVVMAETVVVDTEEVVDYIGDVVDDTLEDNTAAVDVSNGGTANVTGNITACVVVEEDGGTTSEPAVSLEGEGSTANIYGDVKGMVSVHNDGTANIVGDVQDAYGSVSVEGENSTVNIDGNVTGYIDVGLFDGGGTLTITGNVTGGNVQALNGGTISIDGNVDGSVSATFDSNVTVGGNVSERVAVWYGSTGEINGNIEIKDEAGFQQQTLVGYDSELVVHGDIIGGQTGYEEETVEMDITSTLKVDGDIAVTNGKTVAIDLGAYEEQSTGTGILVANKVAGGTDGAIEITVNDDGNGITKEELLTALPEIIVHELEAETSELLKLNEWDMETNETVAIEDTELKEAAYDEIKYIIKLPTEIKGSISVEGAEQAEGHYVAHEDDEVSISIRVDDGYEVESVTAGKAMVTRREDGSYSIVIPRGGGVDIQALIRAVLIDNEITEGSSSNPSVTYVKATNAADNSQSYANYQKQLQQAVQNVATDGKIVLDMQNWISFDRKTFEELSKRSDVDYVVIYRYRGKDYRVVIPAGYNLMELLDENGYCGCLYLNKVFGAVVVEK